MIPEPSFPQQYPHPRRRPLFAVLRQVPLVLLVGMGLGKGLICALDNGWIGGGLLLGCGVLLFPVWPYLMMYRTVLDRTRGLPAAQPCAGPRLEMKLAAWLTEASDGTGGLIELGFEPTGWFFLDDVDQLYVLPWVHPDEPTIAYVQFLSATSAFRLRFVRRLPWGGALITTTRLVDLAYAPPPGSYTQRRAARRPAGLWAWHREAERFLLGDRPAPVTANSDQIRADRPVGGPLAAHSADAIDPVRLYLEQLERVAWHIRLKRFWLLRFGLLRELWRQGRVNGLSVSEQVEDGWAPAPPWASEAAHGLDKS